MSFTKGSDVAKDAALARIFYFLRCGLYQHAVEEATKQIRLSHPDQRGLVFFWKACALGLSGNHRQSVKNLQKLRQVHASLEYPVTAALLWCHQKLEKIDCEEVEVLEQVVTAASESATGEGALLAAAFFFYAGCITEAKQSLALLPLRSVVGSNNAAAYHTVNAWIGLNPSEIGKLDAACKPDWLSHLELNKSQLDLDSLLCLAKWYEVIGEKECAVDSLNRAVALDEGFIPAYIEKAKILLSMRKFREASEAAQQATLLGNDNVEALRTALFIRAVSQGFDNTTVRGLSDLVDRLLRVEQPIPSFWLETSRLFARISCGAKEVLLLTIKLVEKAKDVDPLGSELEAGFQQRLLGNYDMALENFQSASNNVETSMQALYGMIHCLVLLGDIEGAEQQKEFLSLLHQDEDAKSSPELDYVEATLALHTDKAGGVKDIGLLRRAAAKHLELIGQQKHIFSVFEEYTSFDPAFLMALARDFLRYQKAKVHICVEDFIADDPAQSALDIFEHIVDKCPGNLEAWLLLARLQVEMKSFESARETLEKCCVFHHSSGEKTKKTAPIFLLFAKIHAVENEYHGAQQRLEQALSLDFSARDHPVYRVVKCRVLLNEAKCNEAKQLLQETIRLPGIVDEDGLDCITGLDDRVACFVLLSSELEKTKQSSAAQKILEKARELFKGTSGELGVLVAMSNMALKNNHVAKATRLFDLIPHDSPLYSQAQTAKAEIHLHHSRDRQAFIQCHLNLVAAKKTVGSLTLLGNAHMRLQNPESAINSFEQALRMDANNKALVEKIGKALIATHNYKRALEYYENVFRNLPGNEVLRADLVKLYMTLGLYSKAAKMLKASLGEYTASDGISTLTSRVATLLMLSDVYKESNETEKLKSTLLEGQRTNMALLGLGQDLGFEQKSDQQQQAATICKRLAQCAGSEGDLATAERFYNEALAAWSEDEEARLLLARLLLRQRQFSKCHALGESMLRAEPDCADALILLGDCMHCQSDFDRATEYYARLLGRDPNNYEVLAKCITMLRRAGKLGDVPRLIKQAEREERSLSHAGLFFCKGLLCQYLNEMEEAIENFNRARRDGEYGERSTESMILIYLNPSNSALWDVPSQEYNSERAIVVETLIKELHEMKANPIKVQVLISLAFLVKGDVVQSQKMFMDILDNDKECISALFGLALTFLVEGSKNKALNLFKRIIKAPFSPEYGDELEKSYLILSELYIEKGKYDLAKYLCQRCLAINKSSSIAWSTMGAIVEAQQNFAEAAECYREAWAVDGETSPLIGFKLAVCHQKNGGNLDAIETCIKVQQQSPPDHPRIKELIFDRCVDALRP